jgi:hypothetical protein
MVNIGNIITALQPSERSLITVETYRGKVLVIIEPVKKKNKKKLRTAVRKDLG